MAERRKRPPGEALVDLRRRLSLLSPRDPGRTEIVARAADAYPTRAFPHTADFYRLCQK